MLVLQLGGWENRSQAPQLEEGLREQDGRHTVPDFVNTQAINARALVQGLAYPYMQAAIAQLFYQTKGQAGSSC